MAVHYEIEDGVLVLRLAAEGFSQLRAALRAAAEDPASRPAMPLLLDLRGEPPNVRYEDVRWRTDPAEMRKQSGCGGRSDRHRSGTQGDRQMLPPRGCTAPGRSQHRQDRGPSAAAEAEMLKGDWPQTREHLAPAGRR
jgi:hypothetical protein